MSSFKEGPKIFSLKSNERILMINRFQIKEIFRWSSKLKEDDPYTRSQGDSIIELLKRNLSAVNPNPVPVVIQIEEIKTLIWWQELTKIQTDLTESVLTLLKNTRDNIKPEVEAK